MMRKIGRVAAVLALGVAAVGAHAQSCPAGFVRVTGGTPADGGTGGGNFVGFITGARICAARGGDRWQEFHQSGGSLFDWKLGPGHAIDPRKQVGTWSATNGANASLTHTYSPAGSYTWIVCRPDPGPGDYTLESSTAGTITGVKILAGEGACP